MINTHYRAKSNGLWVYGDLYNNCDRGVNQNFIVRDNENIGTGEHILVDSYTTGISICTMVKDRNGNLIYEGDFIKYSQHKGYMLPNFIAEVQWINDSACFGYKRNDVPNWSTPTPFVEHDELQNDFLNFVEVVGNIWDNEISELVARHSI